ncbi:hypothetical protein ICW40_00960 [Actinotalea ferrariae]|uniref:hypothetical protein n=1 Tax=Actinotalea ferrariae TaxID=1386098 RepID=UPI001C8C31FF|nr:hypothetical protein [Actinotalea ferrariae]MBX9243374.1 hypothetical protein [Actinotalea ferrariae]
MASLTSFLLWIPQGTRVWKARRTPEELRGIALSTQVISLAGSALWLAYAVLIGSFWLGAPVVVNGPIAIMTLVVLVRGRRALAAAAPAPDASVVTATAVDAPERLVDAPERLAETDAAAPAPAATDQVALAA